MCPSPGSDRERLRGEYEQAKAEWTFQVMRGAHSSMLPAMLVSLLPGVLLGWLTYLALFSWWLPSDWIVLVNVALGFIGLWIATLTVGVRWECWRERKRERPYYVAMEKARDRWMAASFAEAMREIDKARNGDETK